ncbi:hypothetical protein CRUP_028290 [Coryphaenoides rupestris]|nr:hypothetical protein CRUP_028290 [Coryphaenoides rupestris]
MHVLHVGRICLVLSGAFRQAFWPVVVSYRAAPSLLPLPPPPPPPPVAPPSPAFLPPLIELFPLLGPRVEEAGSARRSPLIFLNDAASVSVSRRHRHRRCRARQTAPVVAGFTRRDKPLTSLLDTWERGRGGEGGGIYNEKKSQFEIKRNNPKDLVERRILLKKTQREELEE